MVPQPGFAMNQRQSGQAWEGRISGTRLTSSLDIMKSCGIGVLSNGKRPIQRHKLGKRRFSGGCLFTKVGLTNPIGTRPRLSRTSLMSANIDATTGALADVP